LGSHTWGWRPRLYAVARFAGFVAARVAGFAARFASFAARFTSFAFTRFAGSALILP
jgi:hypothetical protein